MLLKSTTFDERLEKNWIWCQKYFERKKTEFHLKDWKIKLDNAKKRLGCCDYNTKTISISSHFLRGPTCEERKMRNTVLHELAHAIVGPKHNHDNVWKTMAVKIGCDGKTTSCMDLPDAKYTLECPNKCFVQPYYRKPKIDGKVCLKCKAAPVLKILK